MSTLRTWAGALHRPTDWIASCVVFLVALPLSMGIAVASGAPVASGLIAAIVGGIVVGLLGGAPLLVSGPSAGTAVLVAGLLASHGFAGVAAMTILCGLLQLLFSASRMGRMAAAVAPPVLQGMLSGIGVLIAISQLAVVLGQTPRRFPMATLRALPEMALALQPAAVGLGLLTMVILLAWPRHWRVPGGLVAVGASTAIAVIWQLDVARVQLPGHLWQFQAPDLHALDPWTLLQGAICMALVVSTESLLSALAVDKLHDLPRARLNRELLGQGVANMVSGFLGGLPVTGVIVRGSVNVQAGARSRVSAILHGIWLLVAATCAADVLAQVPLAALAGLLVITGMRLVNVSQIKTLHAHGMLPEYVATLAGVVGVNLLTGIGIGLAIHGLRAGMAARAPEQPRVTSTVGQEVLS